MKSILLTLFFWVKPIVSKFVTIESRGILNLTVFRRILLACLIGFIFWQIFLTFIFLIDTLVIVVLWNWSWWIFDNLIKIGGICLKLFFKIIFIYN